MARPEIISVSWQTIVNIHTVFSILWEYNASTNWVQKLFVFVNGMKETTRTFVLFIFVFSPSFFLFFRLEYVSLGKVKAVKFTAWLTRFGGLTYPNPETYSGNCGSRTSTNFGEFMKVREMCMLEWTVSKYAVNSQILRKRIPCGSCTFILHDYFLADTKSDIILCNADTYTMSPSKYVMFRELILRQALTCSQHEWTPR